MNLDYLGCELSSIEVSQIFISIFLAICFLQSGIDKILDRNGNLEWLTGHFANSIFKNIVPTLLSIITLLELVGGFLCMAGSIDLFISNNAELIFYGLIVIALSLIFLFLGQRIAKEYDGAAVLVNYFILTILGLFSFSI